MIVGVLASIAVSLVVIWLAFIVMLLVTKPEKGTLAEAARIIPDTGRLIHGLAADRTLHRGVRLRLWLLLAYLASPIDLIPDFLPVIGYADDAIVLSLVLRSVIKRAGVDKVRGHWPGTPDGLDTLSRLCRLPELRTSPTDPTIDPDAQ
jgi:uncharacterized membrane protein YkvA (DUF1232 family)